jgi:hypothetical protein
VRPTPEHGSPRALQTRPRPSPESTGLTLHGAQTHSERHARERTLAVGAALFGLLGALARAEAPPETGCRPVPGNRAQPRSRYPARTPSPVICLAHKTAAGCRPKTHTTARQDGDEGAHAKPSPVSPGEPLSPRPVLPSSNELATSRMVSPDCISTSAVDS